MSTFLRGRLRRLEEANRPPTVMILILEAGWTDERVAAAFAKAEEMVGPDGTVIVMDHRDGIFHQPGPPTRRKSRPGEPDYEEPIALDRHLGD